MSKFHVGDRVRVTGDTGGYGHEIPVGEVVTVTWVYYGGRAYDVVDSDGDRWSVGLEDLRPADIVPLNESDSVNHPSHYTRFKGVEVIDLTEQLSFNLGNAVKYVCRAGHKDPAKTEEDLRKAVWYIEREIARLAKEDSA